MSQHFASFAVTAFGSDRVETLRPRIFVVGFPRPCALCLRLCSLAFPVWLLLLRRPCCLVPFCFDCVTYFFRKQKPLKRLFRLCQTCHRQLGRIAQNHVQPSVSCIGLIQSTSLLPKLSDTMPAAQTTAGMSLSCTKAMRLVVHVCHHLPGS